MQDEQQVERLRGDRVDLVWLGRHRKEHVQQVVAVVEIVARVHERLANVQLVGRGRDRGQLGDDAVSKDVAMVRIRSVHLAVVVSRHRTDDGRQLRHRVGIVAEALEEVEHALVEHRMTTYRVFESLELVSGRQLPVQEQEADLHEARVLGELLDRVAPVHEDALLAINKCDIRLAAACGDKTGVKGKDPLLLVQAS